MADVPLVRLYLGEVDEGRWEAVGQKSLSEEKELHTLQDLERIDV
jgi:hypothetical protein